MSLTHEHERTTRTAVRPMRPGEEHRLAHHLAAAMADDPFIAWLTQGEPRRAQSFLKLGITAMAGRHGAVLVTDDLAGGALLMRPGTLPAPPWESIGLLPGLVQAAGLLRVPSVLRALLRLERAHPAEPHWTGLVLGVDPAHQGRGHGRALIDAALRRVDRDGHAAYLETCGERLTGLYERLGFRTLTEVELPAGGPTMAAMWRPAGG